MARHAEPMATDETSRHGHWALTGHRMLLGAAVLVLALPASPVRGQEADELVTEELIAEGGLPRFTFHGAGGFVYQSEADLDDGGNLQVFRYDLGLTARIKLMDQLHYGNTFFFGVNDYDFGGGFGSSGPWHVILNMRLGPRLTYSINQQWGVTAGGIFMFSPESGADWGDSFTGGGLVGAEYRHSDTLFLSLGVAVISQIEDDVTAAPSVGVHWLPHKDWLVLVGGVPTSGGAGASAEVSYRLADPVDLGFGVLYQQRRFRLDDSGLVPDGVGEDNSLPIRLRLGWDINQHIALHLLAGVAVAGKIELEDRNGNHLGSDDYDPAAYVGVRLAGGF